MVGRCPWCGQSRPSGAHLAECLLTCEKLAVAGRRISPYADEAARRLRVLVTPTLPGMSVV